MKKLILYIGSIVFAALMVYNIAINDSKTLNISDLTLESMQFVSADYSENGSGPLWKSEKSSTPCTYYLTTTIYVFDPVSGSYIATTETVSYTGVVKNCIDGWWFCISDCVGA